MLINNNVNFKTSSLSPLKRRLYELKTRAARLDPVPDMMPTAGKFGEGGNYP